MSSGTARGVMSSSRSWLASTVKQGESAIEAAEKLESNYEQTRKSIVDFRTLLVTSESQQKQQKQQHQQHQQQLSHHKRHNQSNEYESEEEVSISSPESDTHDYSVEFNMSSIDFNASLLAKKTSDNKTKNRSASPNAKAAPLTVQDRLLSYGEALYVVETSCMLHQSQ